MDDWSLYKQVIYTTEQILMIGGGVKINFL